MSRYSDHTTVGGQVLAHRFRMMQQNWKIIINVGKFSFLGCFLFYLMTNWKLYQVWNYLCCLKASYRVGMSSLPSSLFSSSTVFSKNWISRVVSDYFICKSEMFMDFKTAFEQSLWFNLKLSISISILAMLIMVLLTKYFGKSLTDDKETISGHDYVDSKTLKKEIKNKSDIKLGDISYPKGTEVRHTIITGTTGSGKTNIMLGLLDQIAERNERAIIVDTVGTFVDRYYKEGRDIILNPLDSRAALWDFQVETRLNLNTKAASIDSTSVGEHNLIVLKMIADCLIDSGNKYDKFWEDAAKIVFVETAKRAFKEGKSTKQFIDLLLKVPPSEIQRYLRGTYAYSLMDIRAEKIAISIRAVLINAISVFDILKEGSGDEVFSIRDWVLDKSMDSTSRWSRCMFLNCRPKERATMIPLITAWLSIATESLLHGDPTDKRTWIFIDELHNLKRLPRIETSLAELRKFGGCFVIGTQTVSQLDHIYGHNTSKTITSLCGTKVVMAIPEPETAKYMSGFLGEKEEISTAESISYGANTIRDGVNISQQTKKKESVPPSEIMNLKTGEAFMRFPDISLVAKVKFPKADNKTLNTSLEDQKEKYDDIESSSKAKHSTGAIDDAHIHTSEVSLVSLSQGKIAKAKNFIEQAREQNKKLLIIEDASLLYDSCFIPKKDILLNPQKENGYYWDIVSEFDGNYLKLSEFLLEQCNDEGNTKIDHTACSSYLFKMFSNIENFTHSKSSADILNKVIFEPFSYISENLSVILGVNNKDNTLLKYSEIRDYLSLKFNYLKPPKNKKPEISMKQYTQSGNHENSMLFLSCFDNAKSMEMKELFLKNRYLISGINILVY